LLNLLYVGGWVTYDFLPPIFDVPTNQRRDLLGCGLVPDVPVLDDAVPEVAEARKLHQSAGLLLLLPSTE
jgi:hypothetical protein